MMSKNNLIISVIGLGYVGLPVAVAFAKSKYDVIGFDLNKSRLNELNLNNDKTGEVSKHSLIGKFAPYPFTAEIENMGIYGDSMFYKNRFSIRSDEELKIGMQIEVIEHEKRTFTSFVKNHPTFLVKVLIKENKEEITND